MTEIPEADEELLRARLHTIGDAIDGRFTAGRDRLFEPRRPRRLLVTATVAAAAVVLVVVAITLTRGPGTQTTRVMAGSGELDGLDIGAVGIESSLVSTPQGIVVVKGDHGGHPSVYSPGQDGKYRWYVNESVPELLPVSAWWAGDVLRAVGHRCPPSADSSGSAGEICDTQPIVALTFSPDTQKWSSATTVDTHGLKISTAGAVGTGRTVVAPILRGDDGSKGTSGGLSAFMAASGEPDGLARIDIEDASVTRLQGEAAAPVTCPSADTFLVGTSAIEPTSMTRIDPQTGAHTTTDTTGKARAVGLVEGARIRSAPIDVPGASGRGRAAGDGCADGGILVSTSGDDRRPLIVVANPDGGSVTMKRPPAAPLSGGFVSYQPDLTGTVLVASIDEHGSGKSYEVAVWDSTRRTWKRLDGQLPSPSVAVARDGTMFVVDYDHNGAATLRLVH